MPYKINSLHFLIDFNNTRGFPLVLAEPLWWVLEIQVTK